MDPFTLALATFGVQKLRGKSTNRALRDAAIVGGIGQLGAMTGAGQSLGFKGFGQIGAGALPGTTIGQQFGQTSAVRGIGALFGKTPQAADVGVMPVQGGMKNVKQQSFFDKIMPKSTAGKIGAGVAATSLLADMTSGKDEPDSYLLPLPNQSYSKLVKSGFAGTPTGFMTRDYTTGVNTALENPETYQTVEEILGDEPTQKFKKVEYNSGGIVNVAKYNEGGINYLPSKVSHDENDVNNYVRASGYVEDGAGKGNENEDTMLAQLADGEFVSRAAAVRGAGIIAGASITSKEDQRKKGAEFFYEQQKRFKRIYDLIDANRKDN
jgi:hypothetical protein